MKIAQVSPLYESVPPKMYGGTERVVSWLTEALVEKGHEVTLFASGDSRTKAKLIPGCDRSLRLKEDVVDGLSYHITQLQKVQNLSHEFDLIHYHTDYFHFPVSRNSPIAHLTTLHGRLDLPGLQCVYNEFSDMPVVSISESQRKPLPQACFVGNIYHGIPAGLLPMGNGGGEYLAFLGRICPEKNLPGCIEVAKRTGIPLKIAAKIDKVDRDYFNREIKHLLDHPLIEFVGEINDEQKPSFLGNALATLFLIDWPEPFGLVMIESMACGTPVIAYPNGSVPEIIEEARSGFIVQNVEQAAAAVESLYRFDRTGCRERFEARFTVEKMTNKYLELFTRIIVAKETGRPLPVKEIQYEERRSV